MNKHTILPVSGSFEIDYRKSDNTISRRVIDLKQFTANADDGYVRAFCRTRRMARTFKYRSILSATDIATGEIISADSFPAYIMKSYQAAPERELDFFIRNTRPIVDILVYIAKSDGKYLTCEQRSIADWLITQSGMASDYADYALNIIKRWPAPDRLDFIHAAGLVNQQFPEWRDAILEKAAIVAAVDRKVTEEEAGDLILLKRLLRP